MSSRERERDACERERDACDVNDITLKSRVIMHMITSTARRPNASTRKRQEAWRLSARACRDLACRVFECMIVLPWFTQYQFSCSSVRVQRQEAWRLSSCSSVRVQRQEAWRLCARACRDLACRLGVSSVRVHDCPAVIYPVPLNFRVRVFECMIVRWWACRDLCSSAWLSCRDLPSTISCSSVRVHDCSLVSLPWFTQYHFA